ncbi:MAG TPA: dUTP diphosphatase [Pseudomonadales bacterium]|nr:dUTP diphosphatase [Pseudomonadales bacterium]
MSGSERGLIERMYEEMCALQEHHNAAVDSQWRDAGFEYYRAVWVECAELLDHFGWKWWKKQEPDLEQVKLELIDIWHFGLSMLIRDGADRDEVVDLFHAELGELRDSGSFHTDVEALARAALAEQRFDVMAFIDCLNALGMDMVDLFLAYVGKNVLNNFRQANGYQDGTYRKMWAGREDNVHLLEVIATLDTTVPISPDELYAALAVRYAETAGD